MISITLRSCCRLLTSRLVAPSRCQAFSRASSSTGLSLQYQDDVAVIKMAGGENRLNPTWVGDFLSLLDKVESNPASRALVTIGEGKFYSLGFDLAWLGQQSDDVCLKFFREINDFLYRIRFCPLPTLAAINGHSFAGGFLIMASHDMRTMNRDKGWISLNEVLIGIPPNHFMLQLVKDGLGSGQTGSDITLLGRRYTGTEAVNNGIVHAAFPQASLLEDSIGFLNSMVDKKGIPRESLTYMKKSVYKKVLEEYAVVDGPGFESSETALSLLKGVREFNRGK